MGMNVSLAPLLLGRSSLRATNGRVAILPYLVMRRAVRLLRLLGSLAMTEGEDLRNTI